MGPLEGSARGGVRVSNMLELPQQLGDKEWRRKAAALMDGACFPYEARNNRDSCVQITRSPVEIG